MEVEGQVLIFNYAYTAGRKVVQRIACTANNSNATIIKLYQCLNGTGVHIKQCERSQILENKTAYQHTNCSVEFEMKDASYLFYCTQARLNEPSDMVSMYYDVSLIQSKLYMLYAVYNVQVVAACI